MNCASCGVILKGDEVEVGLCNRCRRDLEEQEDMQ